jgi:hypothetical protein
MFSTDMLYWSTPVNVVDRATSPSFQLAVGSECRSAIGVEVKR